MIHYIFNQNKKIKLLYFKYFSFYKRIRNYFNNKKYKIIEFFVYLFIKLRFIVTINIFLIKKFNYI